MEPVRLNKYLSDMGVCSRREADRLVEEGRIRVNGQRPEMGQKVTDQDVITVNGKEIGEKAPEKVIIAVNKPVGVVCTTKMFPGEENIVNMVNYGSRLYPVGRLDKDSQGLIFLTNDGKFAAEVTKASGHHEKEYEVTVNKDITDNFLKRMSKGMYLEDLDKNTNACTVMKGGTRKFRIILTQGLNRQIRRMCETCGYEVQTLKRTRIMNVELGDLAEGEWKEITGEELQTLLRSVKMKTEAAGTEGTYKVTEKAAVKGAASAGAKSSAAGKSGTKAGSKASGKSAEKTVGKAAEKGAGNVSRFMKKPVSGNGSKFIPNKNGRR